MPIEYMNVVQDHHDNSANTAERIGCTLKQRCLNHFVQTSGHTGLGLGYNGCRAAVAMIPTAGFDTCDLGDGVQFSIAYGSSRLHTGLDPFFNQVLAAGGQAPNPNAPFASSQNEQHAEQTAIRFAQQYGHWQDADGCRHVFVDFAPCDNCEPWLEGLPEDWIVHYTAELDAQAGAIGEYKKKRKAEFGRINEPKGKKVRA